MSDIEQRAKEVQKKFINTIEHSLVDLGWNHARLCKEAGISPSHWSEARRCKTSLSLDRVARIVNAVGLDVKFTFSKEENDRPA